MSGRLSEILRLSLPLLNIHMQSLCLSVFLYMPLQNLLFDVLLFACLPTSLQNRPFCVLVSAYLSVCLSVCLCMPLRIDHMSPPVCLSVCLCLFIIGHLVSCSAVHVCVHACMCLYVCLYALQN